MEIIKGNTIIKLSDEEKEIISKATDIFIKILYEMDDCCTLFGLTNPEWDELTSNFEKVSEKGYFELKK